MQPDLGSLYLSHLDHVRTRIDEALTLLGYDTLVISAGREYGYFADDQEAPFHTNPMFAWLCPLRGPHHFIVLTPGKRPRLVEWAPATPWFEIEHTESTYWRDGFDLSTSPDPQSAWRSLEPLGGRVAFLGNETRFAEAAGNIEINPQLLVTRLNWDRSFKTPYEIECLRRANELAARAHRAGSAAFLAGASEYEILQAFLGAIQVSEHELPFAPIVALNEKAATLHYERKRTDVRNGHTLLLDSGAKFEQYGSDITRTTVNGAHPIFDALVRGLNEEQQKLCAMHKPGVRADDLGYETHKAVARLLTEAEVITTKGLSIEDVIEKGLTRIFLPHGLGHQLGVCVHDVGGQQTDAHGTVRASNPRLPKSRNIRTLQPGMVLTVEPGIYFSRVLLEGERNGERSQWLNWGLIDALVPYGGIRIEDDVVVTSGEPENLTRPYLPS